MFIKKKAHAHRAIDFFSGWNKIQAPTAEQDKFTGMKIAGDHRKASSIAAGEKPKRIQPNVTSQNRGFIGKIRILAHYLQTPSNTGRKNPTARPGG